MKLLLFAAKLLAAICSEYNTTPPASTYRGGVFGLGNTHPQESYVRLFKRTGTYLLLQGVGSGVERVPRSEGPVNMIHLLKAVQACAKRRRLNFSTTAV